jgi:hypothetical protein
MRISNYSKSFSWLLKQSNFKNRKLRLSSMFSSNLFLFGLRMIRVFITLFMKGFTRFYNSTRFTVISFFPQLKKLLFLLKPYYLSFQSLLY